MLLHSINVINFRLVEPLLHFSPNSAVNRVQIWTVGSHSSGEKKAGVSHSRRVTVSRVWCARALCYWKIKNSPEISRMTGSSCSVSSTSRQYVQLILTPVSTDIGFVFANLDTPTNIVSNLLSRTCAQQKFRKVV